MRGLVHHLASQRVSPVRGPRNLFARYCVYIIRDQRQEFLTGLGIDRQARPRLAGDGGTTCHDLDTAAPPADTFGTAWVHDRVADFACHSVSAAIDRAVDHPSAANARADGHVE